MTHTEELIKAALAKQVERAPHPGPILHALDSPRRRRRRGLIALVIAVVVAGGVSSSVALQSKPNQPRPAPYDLDAGIPVPFSLTYLPEGFVETGRSVDETGLSHSRSWGNGDSGHVQLQMFGPENPSRRRCLESWPTSGPQGIPMSKPDSVVTWLMDDWCLMMTTDVFMSAAERQKIVDSVRPDGMSLTQSPVRFGWLPSYLVSRTMTISNGPAIDIFVQPRAWADGPGFSVTLAPKAVIDRRAKSTLENIPIIERDLGGGRMLLVQFGKAEREFTQQEQEEILRGIQVVPVDLSWLGK